MLAGPGGPSGRKPAMRRFQPFEPGIEVCGVAVHAVVQAFKLFPSVVVKRLVSHGIGPPAGRPILVDVNTRFPLENWLAAFEDIDSELGPRALFQIGEQVERFVALPPNMTDIHSCLAATNIAYHMNHRKNDREMFDPLNGQMQNGIGEYGYSASPGERRIVSRCTTPYPCDFDRGVLLGFALRFEKSARIEHEPGPCRKSSGDTCTYSITW